MASEDLLDVIREDLRGFDFEAAPLAAADGAPCALAHVRLPGRQEVLLRYVADGASRGVSVRVTAPDSPRFVAAVQDVVGPSAASSLTPTPDGRLDAWPLTRADATRLLGRLALPG